MTVPASVQRTAELVVAELLRPYVSPDVLDEVSRRAVRTVLYHTRAGEGASERGWGVYWQCTFNAKAGWLLERGRRLNVTREAAVAEAARRSASFPLRQFTYTARKLPAD